MSENLDDAMAGLVRRYSYGQPIPGSSITLICAQKNFQKAQEELGCEVKSFCFVDDNSRSAEPRQINPSDIKYSMHEVVYFDSRPRIAPRIGINFMDRYGVVDYLIYVSENHKYPVFQKYSYPMNLRHMYDLAFKMLADRESRSAFAGFLKSKLKGTSVYINQASTPQYFHPKVHVSPGDIVIDGGVGISISVSNYFTYIAQPGGSVYSFEPEPKNFQRVSSALSKHSDEQRDRRFINKGLWSSQTTMFIESTNGSSEVKQYMPQGGHECELTTLDDFVKQEHIEKVDLIKLDIEGAELQALEGAKQTICKHKPKLMISLYHKEEDLYKIPMALEALNCNYKMYCCSHAPTQVEFVLYAYSSETPPA